MKKLNGHNIDDMIFQKLAAQSGDWIYFRNDADSSKLYKVRTDGSGKTKLCDDKIYWLIILGNWIYYGVFFPALCANAELELIYKIRMDGTERQEINYTEDEAICADNQVSRVAKMMTFNAIEGKGYLEYMDESVKKMGWQDNE